jgi:hypothetical protein
MTGLFWWELNGSGTLELWKQHQVITLISIIILDLINLADVLALCLHH